MEKFISMDTKMQHLFTRISLQKGYNWINWRENNSYQKDVSTETEYND